jgi:hypothetical protein
MKVKSVIAYFILAIHSFVLAHTFIPHDHCIRYFDRVMVVCVHEDDNHAQDDILCHDESQYADEYIGGANRTVQDILYPAVTDCPAPATDLAAPVSATGKQTFRFVPLKIPSQYSEALPPRAPPAV